MDVDIQSLLRYEPPFEEPVQPLETKDQMARWLVWQRYRGRQGRSAPQFYRALMLETKDELLWRCKRWPQYVESDVK